MRIIFLRFYPLESPYILNIRINNSSLKRKKSARFNCSHCCLKSDRPTNRISEWMNCLCGVMFDKKCKHFNVSKRGNGAFYANILFNVLFDVSIYECYFCNYAEKITHTHTHANTRILNSKRKKNNTRTNRSKATRTICLEFTQFEYYMGKCACVTFIRVFDGIANSLRIDRKIEF